MTPEEKSLLIKDLCARLPYGVQVQDTRCGISGKLHDMLVFPLYKGNDVHDYIATTNFYTDCYYDDITLFKPYLFPMSGMTEEQKKEFKEISKCEYEIRNYGGFDSEGVYLIEIGKYEYEYDIDTTIEKFYFNYEIINWFNKNHFDYRGLIEKGLAIDATGLNIYKLWKN